MRTAGIIFGLAFVSATPDRVTAADDPGRLGPIVARLGSPDFSEREQASRDLWHLGTDALDGIEAMRKTVADPETRRRLDEIIAKLELARLTTPTRVTIQLSDATQEKAFARIAKESGYDIKASGLQAGSKRSYDMTDVPFWQAVDTVCVDAGATAQHQDDEGNLRVYNNSSYSPYVAYSGPFKIVATNVNASQSLQLANISRDNPHTNSGDSLNIGFQIYAEPKTPLVGVGPVVVDKAIDENGSSLVRRDDNQSRTSRYSSRMNYRSFNMSASANLARSDRNARTIKELHGTVPVMILTEIRPEITISELVAEKEYNGEGKAFKLTVTEVVDLKPGIGFTAKFDRKGGDPNDYSWYNTLRQRVAVLDKDGNKFASNGVNYQQSSQSTCTLKMTFRPQDANGRKLGKPAKLVVYDWITSTTDLAFTFKDVPLP